MLRLKLVQPWHEPAPAKSRNTRHYQWAWGIRRHQLFCAHFQQIEGCPHLHKECLSRFREEDTSMQAAE
jgi:hypothetical protein